MKLAEFLKLAEKYSELRSEEKDDLKLLMQGSDPKHIPVKAAGAVCDFLADFHAVTLDDQAIAMVSRLEEAHPTLGE